jgi:CheY-like chemotaxis protein
VRLAHTGPDGVALVAEARPDLVLCDIGLPGMNGVDVCRRVLVEVVPPPVMVALTGWGMGEDRRRTKEAGFDHHLVKPVALDKLQAVLDSVSARGAAERTGQTN